MKETLEKLWAEYLAEKCAQMDTDEERELTRRSGKLHEEVNALLNKDQMEAVEKYVDAIYDMEALFVKRRFSRDANLLFRSCLRREIQKNRNFC